MPITTCRYLATRLNRCTAEAADPAAPIVLCTKHLALALETITSRMEGMTDDTALDDLARHRLDERGPALSRHR